jgi:hypothetical protein
MTTNRVSRLGIVVSAVFDLRQSEVGMRAASACRAAQHPPQVPAH